jgi:predicted component of type VI protein secretion system
MGAARLEVVAGKAVGMSILVDDDLLIGRHAEGDGRLGDDEEISRSHARVSTDGLGLCVIEDLGSTNGTFVNGVRISSPQTLAEGDTIEIGSSTLVVRELPRPDPAAAPAADRPQPTRGAGMPRPEGLGPPTVQSEPEIEAIPGQPTPTASREQEPPTLPPLSLRLEVDFDERTARLYLDQASEPVLLAFDAGTWRAVSAPSSRKDPPA